MFSTFRMTALAVSVAICAAACGTSTNDPSADPTADTGGADPASDAQQALTVKLNAYIECFNEVDSKVHAGAEHYTSWIKDPEAGPTGRESTVYPPYDISAYNMRDCKPMADAIATPPSLPQLDAAARRYDDALKALQPVSHEVHDYYERLDHEDDQFAKGKQLHAPLMSALSEFVDASAAFSSELDAQNDAAQREHLIALEQAEGRTREYYRLAMMLDAKEIIGLLQEDAFDVSRANTLLEGFNRISDEAHAKVADIEPGRMDWNSFETAAEAFRREGKARVKRVANKTPYSQMEKGWLDNPTLAPEGSPGRLMNLYNKLVFQSNRQ
ncbi:YiiG family protein [Stenotrophomonas tumulicola]|uniref:YiiG family protein n=1 Tax=Stenotrophomonas tumulicola TaxID=1685415 RepID=A0A7W3FLD4_9GAMM|nr:YiiG family protein [Stenotrophomonas tumulicola]MBA8681707.1 YiiG family protein [Stenotrophomonas tumulicola]